jgi:hypothetical protein
MTTGAQHLQYVTTASREMVVETEHLRHEVTKLQADLAASKVESKMRLDELKVLRGVRDEVAASLTLQGLGGGRSVASTSNISAAMTMTSAARAEEPAPLSGSHPHQQRSPLSPERVSAFSFAAEQQPNQRRGSSHAHMNYSSASAHGSQQHAVGPSPSTPKPVHHVSLGLDLGTRRQQAGLRGVHVTDVVEGSSAHQAGIRRNNVLLAVAGKAVNSLEDVAGAVASVKPNSQVVVEYASSGHGGALGDVVRATILVAGYLNGPHNSRREVFRSP